MLPDLNDSEINYRKIGEYESDPRIPNLVESGINYGKQREHERALEKFEEAEKVFLESSPKDRERYKLELGVILINRVTALTALRRFEEAHGCCLRSIALYTSMIADRKANRYHIACELAGLGRHLNRLGRTGEALNSLNDALNIYENNKNHTRYYEDLASALETKFEILMDLNQPDKALACAKKMLKIHNENYANTIDRQGYKAVLLQRVGLAYSELGKKDEAITYYQEASKIFETLVEAGQIGYRRDLAVTLTNCCHVRNLRFQPKKALDEAKKAVKIIQELADEGTSKHQLDLAKALANLGFIYYGLFDFGAAMQCYLRAKAMFRTDGMPDSQWGLAFILAKIGQIQSSNRIIDEVLDVWSSDSWSPYQLSRILPRLIGMIDNIKDINDYTCRAKRLAEKLNGYLKQVSPQSLDYFYPLLERAFTELTVSAINRELWDLALTLVGTARAQRLAKLAQTDLLNRAARTDDPEELAEYRRIYTRLAELEVLLNTKFDAIDGGFCAARLLDTYGDRRHAALHAEYASLCHRLDDLERTLQISGLLPELENALFDGAAVLARLSPHEAIALSLSEVLVLVESHQKPALKVLLLTREHGRVLALGAFKDLTERWERIAATLKARGRGLREGPPAAAPPSPVQKPAARLAVDEQAKDLVQALAKGAWIPIDSTLSEMTVTETASRRKGFQFWKPSSEKPADRRITTVWLIPSGLMHGLPWQASAPPGLRCRIAPAPWFVWQALNRMESPASTIPTRENPLGLLAYEAPTVVNKELFHLALERDLIQAVWGEALQPLTGLEGAHPPATFAVLAGHGDSDVNIPGSARVWVGSQDDGEPRHVGFGDLWRTPLELRSIYFSSCVVGMTREVNGEPLGLMSAGLLRGARYLVGWPVPVDDLGIALFSLLYHWAWREHVDPEKALDVARQAFLSGDWPEAALALARQHLGIHLRGIMNRYLEPLPSRLRDKDIKEKNHLFKTLMIADPTANNLNKPFWQALRGQLDTWRDQGILDEEELQAQANSLADEMLAVRHRFPFRYVGWFALGCG